MSRRFDNPDPSHRPHSASSVFRWLVRDRLSGRRRPAPPGPPAPRVEPDLARLASPAPGIRLTWIGHASFLVTLGTRHVLVDPVFSQRVGWTYPRYGRPGLAIEQLPPLAAVLVSHNHYDHLDAGSHAALDPAVPVCVPLGLGGWFRRRGRRRVIELEWWQSVELEDLEITLVPSRHWSRRRLFDTNRSLWGGFVVSAAAGSVYHAGDSAWFDGFAEIGRRFPGLAAALLPIGAYSPGWFMEHHHMTPEQAGRAFAALGAELMVPMHWGAFQLTDEPISAPLPRLESWWRTHQPAGRLWVPAVGETLELDVAAAQRRGGGAG